MEQKFPQSDRIVYGKERAFNPVEAA